MPKTLLAVDDSATMRKVLEITFAGEDFRVVTAEGPTAALGKMGEQPVAVVIDTSLPDGGDGYALAKEVRSRDAKAVIVVMSSRYSPYDANRGKEAGVDDFIDKPFDSQGIIDKVKKAMIARESGKAPAAVETTAPAAAPAPIAVPAPAAHVPPSFAAAPRPPLPAPTGLRPNLGTQRSHTLSFEGSSPQPPPVAFSPAQPAPPLARTVPSGIPVVQAPPAPAPERPPAPISTASGGSAPVATAVNGHLAGRLGDLGLTSGQIEAVLALSRDVVERVVWEVVPQLAEALIKEEIARITREG